MTKQKTDCSLFQPEFHQKYTIMLLKQHTYSSIIMPIIKCPSNRQRQCQQLDSTAPKRCDFTHVCGLQCNGHTRLFQNRVTTNEEKVTSNYPFQLIVREKCVKQLPTATLTCHCTRFILCEYSVRCGKLITLQLAKWRNCVIAVYGDRKSVHKRDNVKILTLELRSSTNTI